MASASIDKKLDTLTTLVGSGFAVVADDFVALKERMATKADVAEMRLELHAYRTDTEGNFRSLRCEIADINRHLDVLGQHFANLKGVTKEIDDIRERVREIEKHLGLNKKIAS